MCVCHLLYFNLKAQPHPKPHSRSFYTHGYTASHCSFAYLWEHLYQEKEFFIQEIFCQLLCEMTTVSINPNQKEKGGRICRMVAQLKTLRFLTDTLLSSFLFLSPIPLREGKEDPCRSTNSNISLMKKYPQQKPGLFSYLEKVWLETPFYRIYQ